MSKSLRELNPKITKEQIAWNVATSTAIETGQDPQVLYDYLMSKYEARDKHDLAADKLTEYSQEIGLYDED